MGCCTSSAKQVNRQIPMPKTVYLHRGDKSLLWIEGDRIEKQRVPIDSDLPEDSAILYSKGNVFFLAGGTDSSGSLSTSFISIELKEKVINKLPNMPTAAKNGVLLQSGNWIFHVGGTDQQGQVAPVMRYHVEGDYWENKGQLVPLLNPGAYSLEDKIYFVCGKDPKTLKYNTSLLILSTQQLELKCINNFGLRLECENPVCVGGKEDVLIVAKDRAYKVAPSYVKIMPNLPEPLNSNYPLELSGDRVIAYSYPKAFLILTRSRHWSPYNIAGHKEYQAGDAEFTYNRYSLSNNKDRRDHDSSSSVSDNEPAIVLVDKSDSNSATSQEEYDASEREKSFSKQSHSKNKSYSQKHESSDESSSDDPNCVIKFGGNSDSPDSLSGRGRQISYKTIVRRITSSSDEESKAELPKMEIEFGPTDRYAQYEIGRKISSGSSSSGSRKRFRPPTGIHFIQRLTANYKSPLDFSTRIKLEGLKKNKSTSSEEEKQPVLVIESKKFNSSSSSSN